MMKSLLSLVGGMILAGTLSLPALASDSALPGTVNYVEGKVTLGEQSLNAKSVGSTTVEPGQSIATDAGKAEMLLTPGVFVRLSDNSALQLVSGNLTKTEVRLDRGTAMIEVDELHKANDLVVTGNGAQTQLKKTGLYEFDADHGQVLVFKGEADVQEGDRHEKVKGGHELALNDAQLKTTGFNKDKQESSDLYKFSSLRSQYISEASADAAGGYIGSRWAPGWSWDPWFSAYTFFPGNGFLYSPFGWGWGFYSPAYIGYYGYPGYFRGGGYYRYGNTRVVPAHGTSARAFAGHGVGASGFHASGVGGGFRGSAMSGGGFHR
jgi:hypothetical protein